MIKNKNMDKLQQFSINRTFKKMKLIYSTYFDIKFSFSQINYKLSWHLTIFLRFLLPQMDFTQRQISPGPLSKVKQIQEQTKRSSRPDQKQNETIHSAEPLQNEEEDTSNSFIDYEQLMVLFIAGWVISLTLAMKDDSKCLGQPIIGFDYNFRQWLWINFGISISIMFLFIIGTLIDLASQKSFITEALQAITMFIILIGGFLKVIWIFIGVTIFLSQLDFSQCSSTIIVYCSAQFLVFLTAFSFVIIRGLIKKFITFPKKKPTKKVNSKIQKLPVQKNEKKDVARPEKDVARPEKSGKSKLQKFIEQTANRQKKQLAFWGTIGWIYAFAMARKDGSECLDDNYNTVPITFREWFFIDGATTLFTFAVIVVLAFKMETEENKTDKRKVFDRLIKSVDWIKKYFILGTLLLLSILFKMLWVLVGMFMFFFDMRIGDTYCKGLVVDYLILYFVEFVYLIVMFLIITVYGLKRNVIDVLIKKNWKDAKPLNNENVKQQQANIGKKPILPRIPDQSLPIQGKLITKHKLKPLNDPKANFGFQLEPIKTPSQQNQPQKPIKIIDSTHLEQPIITNIEQHTTSPKKTQVLYDQEAIDIINRIPYGNSKAEIDQVNKLWKCFDVNQNKLLSLIQTIQGCKDYLQLPLYFDGNKFAIVSAFHGSKNKVKPPNNQAQQSIQRGQFHYFLRYLRLYYQYWIAFRRINPKFNRKIILQDFIQVIPSLEQLGLKVQKPADEFKKLSDKKGQLEFDNLIKWAAEQTLKKL